MNTTGDALRWSLLPAMAMVLALMLGVTGVAAQPRGSLAGGDRDFAGRAASGGVAEVALGKLAQERASNDAVRQFGQRMATDHGKANKELLQMAESKGVSLSTELDSRHKQVRDKLAKLSGNAFDRAYMSEMVKDHKNDVAEFKKQADKGKDPQLKIPS
jgi:putative membrane protein